ncbi:MAG: hypothetical protein ACRD5K_19320, partial [Candidatus Acidiferrales bacterium]
MFKDRKGQQQTLSIRVSERMRDFLDRARKQFSEAGGESLSVSDVAKLLLESAIENRMDDRLETADLLADPGKALLTIRRKWENHQELTRAEWTVLAQYAQSGCEELSSDPELPSRESFAQVVEAFLAVRSLRVHVAPQNDGYYLGNLSGWADQADRTPYGSGEGDLDIIPVIGQRIIRDLRESAGTARPSFVARNLYVALRDERLKGADSLNQALMPFLPRLYLLAARGHWVIERQPIRQERKPWEFLESVPDSVPNVNIGDFTLSSVVTQEGELHMSLNLKAHRIAYSLGPYPPIREFQAMVEKLAPDRSWNGRYFFGHTDNSSLLRD